MSENSASFHNDGSAFPKVISYPYPKPSRPNPVVNLWVANMHPELVRSARKVDSIRLPVPSKLESR